MHSATALIDGGWSLEIAFPLRGGVTHGGLIDAQPGVDTAGWDPNDGAKYWWADFSRAEHPSFNYFLSDANSSNKDIAPFCKAVQEDSPELLGTDKWSCYWEWTWASVGGHAYMHNPDTFGFLEFADANATASELCGNAEWPARALLAQIYQAQVQYVIAEKKYASELSDLLSDTYCTLQNGCYIDDLKLIDENPSELSLSMVVINDDVTCVNYVDPAPTGGPCFTAILTSKVLGASVTGGISENRRMTDFTSDKATCIKVPTPEAAIVAVLT